MIFSNLLIKKFFNSSPNDKEKEVVSSNLFSKQISFNNLFQFKDAKL